MSQPGTQLTQPGTQPTQQNDKNTNYDEPVKFQDLAAEATTYGDCHRHLLQYLLQKHGAVTVKSFWIRFIYIYTCAVAKRNPTTAQCVECNEEQLTTLVNQLKNRINKKIEWMKMELCTVRSEFDGKQLICLVNKHPYHGDLLSIAGFKVDEVYLLMKWLEYVFTNDDADGRITRLQLSDIAKSLPNPITELRLQSITDKLEQDKWVKYENGTYELLPRAIAELENVVRNKFRPTCCALCLRVVVKKSLAQQCECKAVMHQHCFSLFIANATEAQPVTCPGEVAGCKKVFHKSTILRNGFKNEPDDFETSANDVDMNEDEVEVSSANGSGDVFD